MECTVLGEEAQNKEATPLSQESGVMDERL